MSDDIDQSVLEKVKAAMSGFLRQNKGPLPSNAEIIRDYQIASAGIFAPLEDDCEHWPHLREDHAAGVRLKKFDQFLNEKSIFIEPLSDEFGDELYVDGCIMYVYLKHYTIVKSEQRFKLYENIYKTYAAGAWPCGWRGKYPDGHILVYWPFKEEPTFEA